VYLDFIAILSFLQYTILYYSGALVGSMQTINACAASSVIKKALALIHNRRDPG
jgi:hypothetical protein